MDTNRIRSIFTGAADRREWVRGHLFSCNAPTILIVRLHDRIGVHDLMRMLLRSVIEFRATGPLLHALFIWRSICLVLGPGGNELLVETYTVPLGSSPASMLLMCKNCFLAFYWDLVKDMTNQICILL